MFIFWQKRPAPDPLFQQPPRSDPHPKARLARRQPMFGLALDCVSIQSWQKRPAPDPLLHAPPRLDPHPKTRLARRQPIYACALDAASTKCWQKRPAPAPLFHTPPRSDPHPKRDLRGGNRAERPPRRRGRRSAGRKGQHPTPTPNCRRGQTRIPNTTCEAATVTGAGNGRQLSKGLAEKASTRPPRPIAAEVRPASQIRLARRQPMRVSP